MEERVSVILVNYNGRDYNDKCITSILQSDYPEEIQIVIVDNASVDDSLKLLETRWGKHPQIHIIKLDQNYGFSKANNEGIKWSLKQGFEYIMLLNNDTEIEPQAVQSMICCQKKTGCIVVPKIFYADRPNVIWCAGGELTPVLKKAVQTGEGKEDTGQFSEDRHCTFANGCCMLLSSHIIERLGMLDKRFFLYYEDTEYSMRALEKQIGIYYCANAVVYHKVNGATKGNEKPENAYYITRNWLMCNRMHMGGRFYLFFLYFILNRLAWAIIWGIRGKRDMVKATIKGGRDFFAGRNGKY